jgi:hypothetical protein
MLVVIFNLWFNRDMSYGTAEDNKVKRMWVDTMTKENIKEYRRDSRLPALSVGLPADKFIQDQQFFNHLAARHKDKSHLIVGFEMDSGSWWDRARDNHEYRSRFWKVKKRGVVADFPEIARLFPKSSNARCVMGKRKNCTFFYINAAMEVPARTSMYKLFMFLDFCSYPYKNLLDLHIEAVKNHRDAMVHGTYNCAVRRGKPNKANAHRWDDSTVKKGIGQRWDKTADIISNHLCDGRRNPFGEVVFDVDYLGGGGGYGRTHMKTIGFRTTGRVKSTKHLEKHFAG